MSTTTIRIDDELKARVAAAADRAGTTAHSFILAAIAQTVEQAERTDAFHQEADQRWKKILDKGKTVAWDEMRTYLSARASGKALAKPRPRKLSR
jgi:predicted transcriptional regulator